MKEESSTTYLTWGVVVTPDEEFPPAPGLLVAGIMLLLALAFWPYGYYVLLRWVVTAACAYAAWWAYSHRRYLWPWPLGAMALLFNPILPFHMRRSDWQVFDIIGALIAFVAAFALRHAGRVGRREV